MEQFEGIKIYSETDFDRGCTLAQATKQLGSSESGPSLIIFGTQVSGVNITVGQHTRTIAKIIAALLPDEESHAKIGAEAPVRHLP